MSRTAVRITLNDRVKRFRNLSTLLKKMESSTIDRSLLFLDDKQLPSTSNAVERGNRRFRKMQKTGYRVRTLDHIRHRVALDMFRDLRLPPRCQTVQSLHNARAGQYHPLLCYSLKKNDLSPHRDRYWLNAKIEDQEQYEREVEKICQTYLSAEENERNGIHTISTDEKTGIQALKRIAPNKPMEPGKPERIEYEYKRNGTTCLFGNWDVGRGGIVSPFLNPTRMEEDFARNIRMVVATDSEAGWIFVADNLNTHMSESLVLAIAEMLGIDRDSLGKKEKYGILKSMASRKAFLEDESHRIRFVYTPKHCSWLNQIEVWFGGLSGRVLRRGSFDSVDVLNAKILSYIEFYNQTAKPMNWKYIGLPPKTS